MNGKGHLVKYSAFIEKAFRCGVCEHFPNDTFCILEGRHVFKTMPADKCQHFVFNYEKIMKK